MTNNSNVKVIDLETVDLAIHGLPTFTSITKKAKSNTTLPIASLEYKRSKTLNYRNRRLNSGFEIPEYNLHEIAAAEDGDGIIRQTIKKKAALMFKEGWILQGDNERTREYLMNRLLQLALTSNKPTNQLLDETGTDLIRYHNAFWVLRRNAKNSGGKRRKIRTSKGEKMLDPISSVFRLAPETVRIRTDKYGNPVKYLQEMPDGRRESFLAENVIHFYVNRRAGFNFAAPGLLPAIEDVRLLRQIEEYVELLSEQYLFPLFTLSIGSDDWPAGNDESGVPEVDVWKAKIENLDVSAGLVLPHRVKLDVVGYEKVLPVEEYLSYFKKRLYVSCGVSPIDMGEGDTANRNTADSVTKQLIDDVKYYQRSFKIQLEFHFLNQLLLERYNINVLKPGNIVEFRFREIDKDSMIKEQNHNALMFSMGHFTEDEARIKSDLPVIDSEEERNKTYLNVNEIPRIEAETEMAIKVANAAPKVPSSKTSTPAKKTAQNRQQPTNQHGTNLGPTKKKSGLRSEDITRLQVILSDFDNSPPDLTDIRLANWIFSLDKRSYNADICINILPILEILVKESFDLLQDNTLSPLSVRDILFEEITNKLELPEDKEIA